MLVNEVIAWAATCVCAAACTYRATVPQQSPILDAPLTAAPLQTTSLAEERPASLAVRAAGSKGLGVFATADIEAGTYVCDYAADVLNKAAFDARYPIGSTADYTLTVRLGERGLLFLDARDERYTPSRFLNHAQSGTHSCNLELQTFARGSGAVAREPRVRVCIYSNRAVLAGEELQWDYGSTFWDEDVREEVELA